MTQNLSRLFTTLFLCIISVASYCQIEGLVTDEHGQPLAYVNIYIKNTSIGTTTNNDGFYHLKLDNGEYEIVFQYVGYKTATKFISITSEVKKLNLALAPEKYDLGVVEISANAEDPAYQIIREAQAKRQYYKDQLSNYEVDAYVKGFNKVSNVPKKVMGIELGELDNMIDSTRSGVVYLSESVSKLLSKGGKKKEIMISSKVSGDDAGYSFNSAKEMEFNFYSNLIEINRELISPIARNALAHYKYELEGSQYDENGQLVNKIKVIPKSDFGNVFFGYIYINEDLWNIHSLDLSVTKHSTMLPFIDTLNFNQIYAPINEEKTWAPLSNIIKFSMDVFGIDIEGNFACIYSNYLLNHLEDKDFDKTVFKVLENANEQDDVYWETIRPILLTSEEKTDYVRKDSIKKVRENPEYLDSIDRIQNVFKFSNIFSGYTRNNSKEFKSFSITSPINSISINTIQGWNSDFAIDYNKSFNKNRTRILRVKFNTNYGFSEEVFRPSLESSILFNRKKGDRLTFSIGKQLSQYSRQNPITDVINATWTLFFRENYLKAYDKEFIQLGFTRDLIPGLHGGISLDYERREAVVNNYFGGFRQESRDFTSNNPLEPTNDAIAFDPHNALLLRAHFIINIGQKIWSYPDKIFKENSEWPTLGIYYKGGLRTLGADSKFNLVYATLYKNLSLSIYGNSTFYTMAGTFLGDGPTEFIDHFHFLGNQTHIGYTREHNIRFLNLPYYSNSTNGDFVQLHYQHHFNGYILSKIPLLKRTGFQLVGGYKYLNSDTQNAYDEIFIGLDNIGIKVARLFRLDFVLSKNYNAIDDGRNLGVVVGFNVQL